MADKNLEVTEAYTGAELEMDEMAGEKTGTHADEHDMMVLGKTQQLNRNFRFISVLGFSCTAMSTWEITLSTSIFGLLNGGLAGLVWGYFSVWMGYMFVFASIAELASAMPTSGGQYHWISELSPRRCQKILSYHAGWLSVTAWQAGFASLAFIAGTQIQGLIALNNPDYIYERWHGTLLTIAVTSFAILFNTLLAKRLPMVEAIVLIIHILGFFGILIPLWILAPHNSATMVFTEFTNFGGWSSTGVSVMVGMLTSVYGCLGADSAVHMSEEIRDASLVLPRATMWAVVINGSLGFVMMITYCFTLGDPAAILETPTGYPFIQAFFNATQSYVGTSIMVSVIIVNSTSSVISTLASGSRQTWSFARDGGLPFSPFISKVKPGWNIPLNSVFVTFCSTAALSLINIGSTVAFNAICSMSVNALLATYIISISCLILRRLKGHQLPARRWSLGRFGLIINIITVTAATFNWNIVINGMTILGAMVYYFIYGRHKYVGPVTLVKRDV